MNANSLTIPRSWYSKLVNKSGKSDWLAIAILGEVVYAYFDRPSKATPLPKLSQLYFCELYGSQKVCVKRAIKRLAKARLVKESPIYSEAIQMLEVAK